MPKPTSRGGRSAASTKLALLGGRPVGMVKQPTYPCFTPRACRRVTQLMREGRALGFSRDVPEVHKAEAALSRYHGGRHVLTTSSGHSSLQMALAGLDSAATDDVIMRPCSWGASTSCVLHQNAIPVFADGRHYLAKRIYPARADSLGVQLFSLGGDATLQSLDAWRMHAVWPIAKEPRS